MTCATSSSAAVGESVAMPSRTAPSRLALLCAVWIATARPLWTRTSSRWTAGAVWSGPVAGRVKRRVVRPFSDDWGGRVRELSDRLGWELKSMWERFDELSALAEFELKVARDVAEDVGFRLLRGMFDKLELDMECN